MKPDGATEDELDAFIASESEAAVHRFARLQRLVWLLAVALFLAYALAAFRFDASTDVKNLLFAAFLIALVTATAFRLKVRRAGLT